MKLFPKSNKKRIIKKWFKRTGYYKFTKRNKLGYNNGLYWYKVIKSL